jgi:hypothetical protein
MGRRAYIDCGRKLALKRESTWSSGHNLTLGTRSIGPLWWKVVIRIEDFRRRSCSAPT